MEGVEEQEGGGRRKGEEEERFVCSPCRSTAPPHCPQNHTTKQAQEAIEYGLIDAIISKPQLLQERATTV